MLCIFFVLRRGHSAKSSANQFLEIACILINQSDDFLLMIDLG